jgi:hypothetical protein
MKRTRTLLQCAAVRLGCITARSSTKKVAVLVRESETLGACSRNFSRVSRRRAAVVGVGAFAWIGLSLLGACSETSAPTREARGKQAPLTGNYAVTAMVSWVYDIGVGRGVYDLQWTEGDPSNGGGYGSSYHTPLSPDGAFKCGENCGDFDDPDGIPRAIDNSCDPVLYRDTCLQPIQAADSPFIMHGIDSLWADTMAMPDSIKRLCSRVIAKFHYLRGIGQIYSGNNEVSDGYFGTHGGATVAISGYSDPGTHVDQRWLDSTRLGINPAYSRSVVASILAHEALHALKYEHLRPDLPANVPEQDRNNFSAWPWNQTNYGDAENNWHPTGCVRYP